jgi:hypothetical protein
MALMTTWEIVEEALARKRPPRNQEWLADQLKERTGKKITPQAVSNWKKRGVPPARYGDLADLFELTTDQVAGRAPLPWEKKAGWPFHDIVPARFERLTERQKGAIEAKVREMIAEFDGSESGKFFPSQDGSNRRGGR